MSLEFCLRPSVCSQVGIVWCKHSSYCGCNILCPKKFFFNFVSGNFQCIAKWRDCAEPASYKIFKCFIKNCSLKVLTETYGQWFLQGFQTSGPNYIVSYNLVLTILYFEAIFFKIAFYAETAKNMNTSHASRNVHDLSWSTLCLLKSWLLSLGHL